MSYSTAIIKMNNTKTIRDLKKQGVSVRIEHYRYFDMPSGRSLVRIRRKGVGHTRKTNRYAHPKGGETKVILSTGREKVGATASCSLEDNFSYQQGTKIALGRAIKKIRAS